MISKLLEKVPRGAFSTFKHERKHFRPFFFFGIGLSSSFLSRLEPPPPPSRRRALPKKIILILTSVLWIRICTTDIRIRILPFSSVADKMPTKNKFFFQSFLLITFWDTFISVFTGKKSKRSRKNRRNEGFPYFFCLLMKEPEGPKTHGFVSGSTHNTDWHSTGLFFFYLIMDIPFFRPAIISGRSCAWGSPTIW